MLLRIKILLLITLCLIKLQAKGLDYGSIIIPVAGTNYSPDDTLKIILSSNPKVTSYKVQIYQSEVNYLDSTITIQTLSWLIPENIPLGNYFIEVSDSEGNNQKVEVTISKSHHLKYHYQWQNITPNASFSPRDGAGLLKFKNKFWVLGGWNWLHFPTTNSEIYSSEDGKFWDFETIAPWEGRHVVGWTVFKNALWVIGGDNNRGHYINDIWKSVDGLKWERVLDSIPIPKRVLHIVITTPTKLYILGGEQLPHFGTTEKKKFSDVWSSPDGVKWTLEKENAEFGKRGIILGNSYFKDSLWVIGGGQYEPRRYLNDIWNSADGKKWNLVKSKAPFSPRQYHTVNSFDDKLWVTGGFNGKLDGDLNDVWYSDDGRKWKELPDTPWLTRHAHSVVADDDGLMLLGGPMMYSDVWRLYRAIDRVEVPTVADTLYHIAGFRRELYTEKKKGFVFKWYRNDTLVASGNRTVIYDFGEYQLNVTDLLKQTALSQKIYVQPVNFTLLTDTVSLIKGDNLRIEDLYNQQVITTDAEVQMDLLNEEGASQQGSLNQDSEIALQVVYKNQLLTKARINVNIIEPQLYISGDTILIPGEKVIIATDSIKGYTYQWFRDNNAIENTNLNKIELAQAGTYHVEIYKKANLLYTSLKVNVSLLDFAFNVPNSLKIFSGDSITISVTAHQNIIYEWKQNGLTLKKGLNLNTLKIGKSGLLEIKASRENNNINYLVGSVQVKVTPIYFPVNQEIIIPENEILTFAAPAFYNTNYEIYHNDIRSNISDTIINIKEPGLYKFIVKGNSTTLQFTNLSLSFKPVIIQEAINILSDSLIVLKTFDFYNSYIKWYLDGKLLRDDDNSILTTNKLGTYYAELTFDNGNTYKSNSITINDTNDQFRYKLESTALAVEIKSQNSGYYNAALLDVTGKIISTATGDKHLPRLVFHLALPHHFSSQVYIFRYQLDKKTVNTKLLLTR